MPEITLTGILISGMFISWIVGLILATLYILYLLYTSR